jgi:hypothetical protein
MPVERERKKKGGKKDRKERMKGIRFVMPGS